MRTPYSVPGDAYREDASPTMSHRVPTPQKFSLEEALRHWSDPADMAFVDELDLYSADPLSGETKAPVNEIYFERHREWNRRRMPLIEALVAKLRAGELIASGINSKLDITSKREPLAPELWDLLKPGFKKSEATFGSLRIINIEIEAAPMASGAAGDLVQRPEFEFDNGYRHIRIREHHFTLSGKQCKVIHLLHKASLTSEPWVDGCDLTADAGYAFTFIGDAFKRHPNWHELIATDGRGAYKLNLKSTPNS